MRTPVCFMLVYRSHPTRTLTLTRTRTLMSDQCLDAVACEGSRLIHPTWILCLEGLQVDSAGSGCCGVLYNNISITNWGQDLLTLIRAYGCFFASRSICVPFELSPRDTALHTYSPMLLYVACVFVFFCPLTFSTPRVRADSSTPRIT